MSTRRSQRRPPLVAALRSSAAGPVERLHEILFAREEPVSESAFPGWSRSGPSARRWKRCVPGSANWSRRSGARKAARSIAFARGDAGFPQVRGVGAPWPVGGPLSAGLGKCPRSFFEVVRRGSRSISRAAGASLTMSNSELPSTERGATGWALSSDQGILQGILR